MSNEHNEWRKFLQPLVTGVVALLAAITLYFQQKGSEDSDARFARNETRLDYLEQRSVQRDNDLDNLRTLLGDVRADVSFIRGKLEGKK